jgi:ferric-dicitrate binding protein FerR (iron transport regulator)
LNFYDTSQLRVAVKEGVVEVARPAYSGTGKISNASGQSVTLKAGEQVQVTPESPLAGKPADIEAALAWATGRLIFRHETVEQAVREFNHRNELQIEVLDSRLLRRPVRGNYAASDPRSFAALLETQGALTVDEESGTLLIAPYPDAATTDANE